MTGGKGLIWELRDQGSDTNYFALQGNTQKKTNLLYCRQADNSMADFLFDTMPQGEM